jgi:hypothetical protein
VVVLLPVRRRRKACRCGWRGGRIAGDEDKGVVASAVAGKSRASWRSWQGGGEVAVSTADRRRALKWGRG